MVEGLPLRPSRLLPKFCHDQRLAEILAALYMAVDPTVREVELAVLPTLKPRVGPEVDGAKVDV